LSRCVGKFPHGLENAVEEAQTKPYCQQKSQQVGAYRQGGLQQKGTAVIPQAGADEDVADGRVVEPDRLKNCGRWREQTETWQVFALAFGGGRRVTGLRREEVSLLAGISVEYYVRLERGNAAGISESVLDGIGRALQLDHAEHEHLRDLVRAANHGGRAPGRRSPVRPQRISARTQRLLDAMTEVPAMTPFGLSDSPVGREPLVRLQTAVLLTGAALSVAM